MSRREFIAGVSATGVSLAGFAIAATPVAGQIITTPTEGLATAEAKVPAGDFHVPIYEARPAAAGRYPVVLVLPEAWGMHEHIKDVTRRFAREGFLAITLEPYARDGGVMHLPDQASVMRVINAVPDARVMGDLDAIVAYAKQHAAALPERIGVTGFCRGGTY
ncbi:MAG: dienelactone hydrolase family protein, partial [candidate division NC10 bacterium]